MLLVAAIRVQAYVRGTHYVADADADLGVGFEFGRHAEINLIEPSKTWADSRVNDVRTLEQAAGKRNAKSRSMLGEVGGKR